EKPDHRHRWLLRLRRERPRGCRAAEQRDELAPPNLPCPGCGAARSEVERCTADPGPPRTGTVPGLQRSTSLRSVLRCARDTRCTVAPFHSITSWAVAMSLSGTSSPSAFAVLRLMTNSNLVGCWTGRSPGLSPLRMRST